MDAQPPPAAETAGARMRPVLTEAEAWELIGQIVEGAGAESSLDTLLADYQTLRTILDRSAAGIGVLDRDLRYIYVNDALARLNGIPAAEHLGRTVRELIPDLDHRQLDAALAHVLRDGRPRATTLSGRTPSDPETEQRWWLNAYHRLEDESGAVLGVAGVVLEVTETYRVRQLLDAARNRLALLDEAATRISASLDVDHVCRELARLMVPRIADFAAVDVLEPDRRAAQASARIGVAPRGGAGTGSGPPAAPAYAAAPAEVLALLMESAPAEGGVRTEAVAGVMGTDVLSERVGGAVPHSRDRRHDEAPEREPAATAGGPVFRRVALSTTPQLARAAEFLGATGTVLIPQPSSAVARCLDEQRPVVMNEPTDEQLRQAALTPERVARYRELGMHSAVFVPLTVRRDLVGVVVLCRAGSSPPFAQPDVDLVTELARRAATSISHARRFAQEHQTALILQQALLARPRPPHPDVECASRYLPTGKDIEIGGDWYDTVALPGGKTLLVVGDVMGHGVEAAAAMSEYRGLLRTLALQSDDPATILAEAARIADGLSFDRVATCIVAVLDPVEQTCTVASAGHLPPLLVSSSGDAKLLGIPVDPPLGVGPTGPVTPIGVVPASATGTYAQTGTTGQLDLSGGSGTDADGAFAGGPDGAGCYSRTTISFPPGSILLCYTDGLVERRGKDIEECVSVLTRLDLDPAQPLEQLVDHVLRRCDPASWEDDVAVLCARLGGPVVDAGWTAALG